MRNIKELLQILINSLEIGDKIFYFNNGICGEIIDLNRHHIISNQERIELCNYIKSNHSSKSNQYKLFTKKKDGWKGADSAWWWHLMSKNIKYRIIRINYLKELLKNTN